jgi:FtsP/CotA-like multicopper oxidase with cupredoxin domain
VRASEQVERGLYGVLVVEDAQPPPYSRDLVWVLDDFLLKDGQIYPEFNTRHDLAMDGRWGSMRWGSDSPPMGKSLQSSRP